MSKHSTAEEKLHLKKSVRPKYSAQKPNATNKRLSSYTAPPKGTNANNQFR